MENVTVSYSYNTLHQLTEESWTEDYLKSNAGVAEPRACRCRPADGWRHKQYTATGPNGELVREVMFTYATETASVPSSTDEYYYGYDRIASVMNIYDANGDVITGGIFEQDAFGNEMNDTWLEDFTRHFGGHTWEADEGLYHSGSAYDSRMGSTTGGRGTSRPSGMGSDAPKVGPSPVPGGGPPVTPIPGDGDEDEEDGGFDWGAYKECMKKELECKLPDLADDAVDCLIAKCFQIGGAFECVRGDPFIGIPCVAGGTIGYEYNKWKIIMSLYDTLKKCSKAAREGNGDEEGEGDNDGDDTCPNCGFSN